MRNWLRRKLLRWLSSVSARQILYHQETLWKRRINHVTMCKLNLNAIGVGEIPELICTRR
jgi:hypothetical protein